jgi:hypothetical protein
MRRDGMGRVQIDVGDEVGQEDGHDRENAIGSVFPDSAREPGRDLLEEPAVAV